MTRQKKSRKAPSLGPTQAPRRKKTETEPKEGKRSNRHCGLAAGNRNNPGVVEAKPAKPAVSTDPRHGSKKPINLSAAPVEPKPLRDFIAPIELKKVQPLPLAPEAELEQIENDERLMALLERADNGEVLTGKDAKYFNAKTARHQELMEELGYDVDDYEDGDYDDEDYEAGDDEPVSTKSLLERWEEDDWGGEDDEAAEDKSKA